MINLLPINDRRDLGAARANTLLVRYLMLFLVIIAIIASIFGFAYFSLETSYDLETEKKSKNDSEFAKLASKQQQITAFQNNLATSKQILDNKIDYTGAILKIASSIPSNVVLSELTLSKESFAGPLTLSALAKTNEAATGLKTRLEDSIFYSEVHYSSITYEPGSSEEYAYRISINVTLNKEELLKNE